VDKCKTFCPDICLRSYEVETHRLFTALVDSYVLTFSRLLPLFTTSENGA